VIAFRNISALRAQVLSEVAGRAIEGPDQRGSGSDVRVTDVEGVTGAGYLDVFGLGRHCGIRPAIGRRDRLVVRAVNHEQGRPAGPEGGERIERRPMLLEIVHHLPTQGKDLAGPLVADLHDVVLTGILREEIRISLGT
jgi:hypothetical protein